MTDLWDTPDDEMPEPPKPTYASLPDGVAVIVRTTDATDKDTVKPVIKEIVHEKGNFFKFKCPTVVLGGDAKVESKFVGSYLFTEFNVLKPTVENLEKGIATATANGNQATANRLKGQLAALDKYPCGPELYNLILDTLAPEDGTASERWAKAKAALGATGKTLGYTAEMFKGNVQYMYAETFRQVLLGQQFKLIGKTYTPSQKPGNTYVPQQTLGSIGVYTDEQVKKRKVTLMEKEAF